MKWRRLSRTGSGAREKSMVSHLAVGATGQRRDVPDRIPYADPSGRPESVAFGMGSAPTAVGVRGGVHARGWQSSVELPLEEAFDHVAVLVGGAVSGRLLEFWWGCLPGAGHR